MGKLQNGILGTTTGKVGNVVGSRWKAFNTVRVYRPHITKSDTANAVNSRNTFALAVSLTRQLAPNIARTLLQRFESMMSGYNRLLSFIRLAFTLDGTFIPEKLMISKGRINAPTITGTSSDGGEVQISWDTNTQGFEMSDDVPVAAVIDELGLTGHSFDGATKNYKRQSGTLKFNIPNTFNQSNAVYALAFRRADGTLISDTAINVGDL